MKFDHIGIATENIDNTIKFLNNIFEVKSVSSIVYDKNQDASLCMVVLNDNTRLELVSGKMVENIVKKRQFLYHVCYKVSNIEEKIKELENTGCLLVSSPKEAILFENKRVAFMMTDVGLMELVEE